MITTIHKCLAKTLAFNSVLLFFLLNGAALSAQTDGQPPIFPLVPSPSQVTAQDNLHSDMVASFEESLYQNKLNSNRSVPAILSLLATDKLNYDEIFGAIGLTDVQRNDIVAEELSTEQLEQLMNTYPRNDVLRLYSTAQLYTLFSFNKYTLPDSFDRRTSAGALIYGVEIREKKDRK